MCKYFCMDIGKPSFPKENPLRVNRSIKILIKDLYASYLDFNLLDFRYNLNIQGTNNKKNITMKLFAPCWLFFKILFQYT